MVSPREKIDPFMHVYTRVLSKLVYTRMGSATQVRPLKNFPAKRVTQAVIWEKHWLTCGGTCVHI